jgi:hypothetical protein
MLQKTSMRVGLNNGLIKNWFTRRICPLVRVLGRILAQYLGRAGIFLTIRLLTHSIWVGGVDNIRPPAYPFIYMIYHFLRLYSLFFTKHFPSSTLGFILFFFFLSSLSLSILVSFRSPLRLLVTVLSLSSLTPSHSRYSQAASSKLLLHYGFELTPLTSIRFSHKLSCCFDATVHERHWEVK